MNKDKGQTSSVELKIITKIQRARFIWQENLSFMND